VIVIRKDAAEKNFSVRNLLNHLEAARRNIQGTLFLKGIAAADDQKTICLALELITKCSTSGLGSVVSAVVINSRRDVPTYRFACQILNKDSDFIFSAHSLGDNHSRQAVA
jgi:hypothetical protein